MQDEGAGPRQVGFGQDATPDLASPVEGQGVEVAIRDQAAVRALPAPHVDSSDRLRIVDRGGSNLHGERMTEKGASGAEFQNKCLIDLRPARQLGSPQAAPLSLRHAPACQLLPTSGQESCNPRALGWILLL